MSEKFFHISNVPILPDYIVREALESKYEINDYPNIIRAKAYQFEATDFFKNFSLAFGACNAHYLKFFPNSLYDWHIDRKRMCGINWVIKTNPKASTFFREPYDHDFLYHNRVAKNERILFWNLEEVDYTLLKPTLMNTAVDHCVVNNYPEERIILTVNCKEGAYNDVKAYLQSLTIDSY
jgi:hypothetical protein